MTTATTHAALRIAVALCLLHTLRAPSADASVLCKRRHGGLMVRDVCKLDEELLDAPALTALALRGPAGPTGPVGPAGGGLKMLDANGAEVGTVMSLQSYYGQYAEVIRQMTLSTGGQPEFVLFSATPQGLSRSEYACGTYYGTYFKSVDCSGAAYDLCNEGYGCSSAVSAFLYTRLFPGADGIACFSRSGPEFERGDFYHSSTVFGPSIVSATQVCEGRGGSLSSPPTPCPGNPLTFCGSCCTLEHEVAVVPRHQVDLSAVGVPPFRLGR